MATAAMMPPPPPPKGMGSSPQAAPEQQSGDLVGQQKAPGFQNPEVQKRMKEAMEKVKNLTTATEDMAKAFPEFAPHARKISSEFKEGLVKIVASLQQGSEVSSPQLGY